jgi:hypothetical protein
MFCSANLEVTSHMFIRSRVVKGTTYYAVVESYRAGDKVRHRHIAALGTTPTVEGAIAEAARKVKRLRSRLGKLEALWPASSDRPAEGVRAQVRAEEKLALQELRLARLREVRAKLASA